MNGEISFGKCLKAVLANRELSIQEGARLMDMKSATSLSRILHDEVNIKTLNKFYQALLQNQRIGILPEEKAQLDQALIIHKTGIEQYLAHQTMWQLMLSAPYQTSQEEYTIECRGCHLQQHPFHYLHQLIALYESSTEIEITITGCCSYSLLEAFFPLASRKEHAARITHFLHNRLKMPHVLLGSIAAIRRFISLTGYTAYITDPSQLTPEALALYDSNEILCSFVDGSGKRRMHHLVLIAPHQLMLIEYRHPSPFLFLLEKLNHYKGSLSPIQTQFPTIITPADYVAFSEHNRQLEENRAIYSIKPDMHLPVIHPDILLAAAKRGMEYYRYSPNEELKKVIDQLYAIHLQRWKNLFSKKKITHVVLSASAMQKFAQTGTQSDHFFALPPYTPAERRQIFTHLRQQMIENPYFNLYFSTNDSLPFYLEITSYEDKGVMLSNAYSSYDLSKGHAEAMITQQDFSRTFQDFFTQELLSHHVLPLQKALALMDQWIASLPQND